MGDLTHGMNIEQVDELGRFLKSSAESVETLAGSIDARVRSSSWAGDDRALFTNDWWPKNKRLLGAIAKELDGLGQSALNNAQDQLTASGQTPGSAESGDSGSGEWWEVFRNSGIDPSLSALGFVQRLGAVPFWGGMALGTVNMGIDVLRHQWSDLAWDTGSMGLAGATKIGELAGVAGKSIGGVAIGGGAAAWGIAGVFLAADYETIRHWDAMGNATSDMIARAQGNKLYEYSARHGFVSGPAPGAELEYYLIQQEISDRMIGESLKIAWHGAPGLSFTNRLTMPLDGLITGQINNGMAFMESASSIASSTVANVQRGAEWIKDLV